MTGYVPRSQGLHSESQFLDSRTGLEQEHPSRFLDNAL